MPSPLGIVPERIQYQVNRVMVQIIIGAAVQTSTLGHHMGVSKSLRTLFGRLYIMIMLGPDQSRQLGVGTAARREGLHPGARLRGAGEG